MAKPSRSTLLARKAMEPKLALRLVCDTAALHRRLIRKDGGSDAPGPSIPARELRIELAAAVLIMKRNGLNHYC
jgi:hypothetical protein